MSNTFASSYRLCIPQSIAVHNVQGQAAQPCSLDCQCRHVCFACVLIVTSNIAYMKALCVNSSQSCTFSSVWPQCVRTTSPHPQAEASALVHFLGRVVLASWCLHSCSCPAHSPVNGQILIAQDSVFHISTPVKLPAHSHAHPHAPYQRPFSCVLQRHKEAEEEKRHLDELEKQKEKEQQEALEAERRQHQDELQNFANKAMLGDDVLAMKALETYADKEVDIEDMGLEPRAEEDEEPNFD